MKETRRAKITVGLFVAASLVVLLFLAFKLGDISLGPRIAGSALFTDVAGLVEGAQVSVAGVAVGQVRSIEVEGGKARVGLTLFEGHGLTTTARAVVRSRSLLGEKYLALIPGEAPGAPLADGFELDTIAEAPSIEDMLVRVSTFLEDVPVEELAADLRQLHAFLESSLPRLQELLDEADMGELVKAARAVRIAVEEERTGVHRAIAAWGDAGEALQTELPATIADLRTTASNLKTMSESLDALADGGLSDDVQSAREVVRRLPDTLDELDRTLTALQKIEPILDRLQQIDPETLRRFLQQEGVRIRLRPRDPEDR